MKTRGRLKIFLGYAAGVGKTYSMLEAAQQKRRDENVDVVIGIAVTHGRRETERLLEGMEAVPLLQIEYRGTMLYELNLDLILARKPELAVVDELAHTNPPGLRHPKRYADVEELLKSGIDVFTTLNIQHLESYQDTLEKAIGIPIHERIPDRILDTADEIEVIDLPPKELLERLKQGKVYIPEQAKRAIHHFFRMETLQLLREMTFRKTAAVIDFVRTGPEDGREERHLSLTQHLKPRLLASIGPSPFSERVLRSTKRLADMLRAEWYAVSVETPDMAFSIKESHRAQIERHLRLAEELGGKALKISGTSIAQAIISFAKEHGITQIVIGHSLRPWYERLFRKPPVDELVSHEFSVDIYVISSGIKNGKQYLERETTPKMRTSGTYPRVISTVLYPLLALILLTILLSLISQNLSSTTIGMVYLLSNTVAATCFDMVGFALYFFSSLFVFDWLYLPHLERWILKPRVGIFFFAITSISVLINVLAVRRKRLARVLQQRHAQMQDLYAVSRQLVQTRSSTEIIDIVQQHLNRLFSVTVVVAHMEGGNGEMHFYGLSEMKTKGLIDNMDMEKMAAKWVIDHGEPAGCRTSTLPLARALWLPLSTIDKTMGAMAIFSSFPEIKPVEDILESNLEDIEAYVHLTILSLSRVW